MADPDQPNTSPTRSTPDLPGPPGERRVATDAEARALASGIRLRMLRLCLDEALTNRELAEELDLNPATALHHVRTLVDTGFLVALDPRRGRRGAREIPYRATGKSWGLDAGDVTHPLLEAFAAELHAAPYDDRFLGRLAVRLPPDQVDELRQRLTDLLDEFRARPRDPDADQWALFVALHASGRRGAVARHEQGADLNSDTLDDTDTSDDNDTSDDTDHD